MEDVVVWAVIARHNGRAAVDQFLYLRPFLDVYKRQALCGSVFKVEYTDCGQRSVYLRLYSGTLRLRDMVALAGREKLKITEMRIPPKGEIVRTDTAYPGEIVILPSDSVRLNDVLGLSLIHI